MRYVQCQNKRFLPFFLCSMLLFLKLYGSVRSGINLKFFPLKPWFALNISVARVWRFLWCILTLLTLTITSKDKHFRSQHILILKLSHEFYWLCFPCFYCLNRSFMASSKYNSEKDQQTAYLLQHQYHYQLSSMVFHILQ